VTPQAPFCGMFENARGRSSKSSEFSRDWVGRLGIPSPPALAGERAGVSGGTESHAPPGDDVGSRECRVGSALDVPPHPQPAPRNAGRARVSELGLRPLNDGPR